MRDMVRRNILWLYDIILSLGAVGTGVMMILSNYGVFKEYPNEWLAKIPFNSWVVPGIIIIIIFGLGNMVAAISACRNKGSQAWIMSAGMGLILLSCVITQRILLGEWYLPDNYFVVFSIVQIFLSRNKYLSDKKQGLIIRRIS